MNPKLLWGSVPDWEDCYAGLKGRVRPSSPNLFYAEGGRGSTTGSGRVWENLPDKRYFKL